MKCSNQFLILRIHFRFVRKVNSQQFKELHIKVRCLLGLNHCTAESEIKLFWIWQVLELNTLCFEFFMNLKPLIAMLNCNLVSISRFKIDRAELFTWIYGTWLCLLDIFLVTLKSFAINWTNWDLYFINLYYFKVKKLIFVFYN